MNISESSKRSLPLSSQDQGRVAKRTRELSHRPSHSDNSSADTFERGTSRPMSEAKKEAFDVRRKLGQAIKMNHVEEIRECVRRGANVNDLDPLTGRSFIISTLYTTLTFDACKELVSHGADLDAECEELGTALHMAVSTCNVEASRFLSLAGADPQKPRKSDGASALDIIHSTIAYQDAEYAQRWAEELKDCRNLWCENTSRA